MRFEVGGDSWEHNKPNQDAWLARADGEAALVAVFDGVSSSAAGRCCSHTARAVLGEAFEAGQASSWGSFRGRKFRQAFRSWWTGEGGVADRLRRTLLETVDRENSKRLGAGEPRLASQEFQSTLAVALALGANLGVVWAGDSRIYHFRDSRLRCLTVDDVNVVRSQWPGDWNEAYYFAVGSGPLVRWLSPHTEDDHYHFKFESLEDGELFFASSDGFHELCHPWTFERRFVQAGLLARTCDELVALVSKGLAVGEDDDTSIALAAAVPVVAMPGFPTLLPVRLETLGSVPLPELGTHWARFQVSFDGDPEEIRKDCYRRMRAFLEDPGLGETLRSEAGAARRGPRRLAQVPGRAAVSGWALAPDGVELLRDDAAVGRAGFHGPSMQIFAEGPSRRCFQADGVTIHVARGEAGRLTYRVERIQGDGSVLVECESPFSVWLGLPPREPMTVQQVGLHPVQLLVGRSKLEVFREGVSVEGGPITPWTEFDLERLGDRWASRQHARLRWDEARAEVVVEDLGAENGTWILAAERAGGTLVLPPAVPWKVSPMEGGRRIPLLLRVDDDELGVRIEITEHREVEGRSEEQGGEHGAGAQAG